MRVRHKGRESAFQFLYRLDSLRTLTAVREPTDLQARLLELEAEMKHFDLPEQSTDFARNLALGALHHLESLDATLQAHSTHWRLDRMPAVDRNILRIAAYELLMTTTPIPVVLDEALELAKRFGSVDSPSFVNGVLDQVARLRPKAELSAAV